MKYFVFIFLISSVLLLNVSCDESSTSSTPIVDEVTNPCDGGLAAELYACNSIGLHAHVSLQELGAIAANDIWGWTDPSTGKDYALIGLFDAVGVVDVSDPNNPVYIARLNEHSSSQKVIADEAIEEFPACFMGIGDTELGKIQAQGSIWRDIKVYNNHAFVVADGQIHGMQVFDLTKLRDYDGSFMELSEDVHYDRLGNAHNIAINEETGFAYAIGVTNAEICGSRAETGLHIIDINDPLNPQFAGCYFDPETEVPGSLSVGVGYIHDTQCVNYNGSDSEHVGKEICVSSAEGSVVITDVTDKTNPSTIGFSGASRMQYSHQGWLTEDHRYFLMNDELDEGRLQRNTKTYIWDVQDLDNPTFVGHYTHDTPAIDHNLYIHNNFVYQSNYTSGLRVFRIGDLSTAELIPVAYFDTEPALNSVDYEGTWSNYPYFESGIIIVSDINRGLFVLKPEFD